MTDLKSKNEFKNQFQMRIKNFINFFNYAPESANKSRFWLDLFVETKGGDPNLGRALLNEVMEIANILAASILTMKGKNNF